LLKKTFFSRLLKKGQMQGPRNPEGGVATNKERLLPRRREDEAAGKFREARDRWPFFSNLLEVFRSESNYLIDGLGICENHH